MHFSIIRKPILEISEPQTIVGPYSWSSKLQGHINRIMEVLRTFHTKVNLIL
jgi:hypothetical protein